jgi:hypothetical protein
MTTENIAAITELSEIILAANDTVERQDFHSFASIKA